MSFTFWLAFASLFSSIHSAAVDLRSTRPLSTFQSLGDFPASSPSIQSHIKVIPASTVQSRFVVGGWDSLSNLTILHKRDDEIPGSNVTLGTPTNIDVHCDGHEYGSPSRFSCGSAFVDIPEDGTRDTLGDRTMQGQWDVPLPFRFVSCKSPIKPQNITEHERTPRFLRGPPSLSLLANGRCVIEFNVTNPGVSDRASGLELRAAAYRVLRQCVMPLSRGGVITGVGENRQLSVVVKAFAPQVHCQAPATPYAHDLRVYCQQVLNTMPTSTETNTFSLRGLDTAVAFARVSLPITFVDGTSYFEVHNLC